MGDRRWDAAYETLEDADDPATAIAALPDDELVGALAAASTRRHDPYVANVLATEILNRMHRRHVVLETADEGLVSVDANGFVAYANPAARALLGFTHPADANATTTRVHVADFAGEGDAWKVTPLGRAVLDGEAGRVHEATFRSADGVLVPVAYAVAPVVQDDAVIGAVVAFRDVTALKRATAEREALLESTRRRAAEMDAVFASIPDAIYIGDATGIKKANAAALDLLGVESVDDLDRSMPELAERLHARDPVTLDPIAPGEDAFTKALNGTPTAQEVVIRCVDSGKDIIVRCAAAPVLLDGEIGGAVAVTTDVTAVKRQEAALREGRERVEGVLERITDAYFALDDDWRFTHVNGQAARLLGRSPEDLVGKLVWEAFPEAVGTRFQREYERARRTGEATQLEEYYAPMDVWFEVQAYPGPDDLSVFFRDVTARHRAEDAIKQARDDLQRRVTERTRELAAANAELDAFSHMVSHDLRAPLRGIEYFSRLLEEEASDHLPDEQKEYVTRLRRESTRLSTLVNDLLDLARVTGGDLEREDVDVTDEAWDVVRVLRAAHPERDVTIHVEDGLVANADPRLVRVVLENLIGNAWKYTAREPDARVTVGRTTRDGDAYLFVRDNGIGFDPAESDRLFTPFQRLRSSAGFEGSGVGLATVSRIVTRHGGRLFAESDPGHGATFYFHF